MRAFGFNTRRFPLLPLLAAALTGCAGGLAGWHRPSTPVPASFPPRQQVQIWHGGRNVVWHGVGLRADTLTGIPFHQSLECDACRQRLAMAAVDSLRLGSLERVGWLVAASPWLVGALLLIYFRASWGSD